MQIWQLLKVSFKQFYNNLFRSVLLSLFWFFPIFLLIVIALTGISSGWILPAVLPILLLGPFTLSFLNEVKQLSEKGTFSIKNIFIYFKEKFWRGLFAFLTAVAGYSVLIIDLMFFFKRSSGKLLYTALSFLFLYLIVYYTIYQAYVWGLLIVQPDKKLRTVLKNALIISIDNIFFSLLFFAALFLITLILVLLGVGIPSVFMGFVGLFIINVSSRMLNQY
ncbi:MAG: hypothetical protein ACQESS_06445 [Bacillota bacterium]